jgi:hypothetical protein
MNVLHRCDYRLIDCVCVFFFFFFFKKKIDLFLVPEIVSSVSSRPLLNQRKDLSS